MRFKNLLGLLAIGGAVAYAQKKRGGDLSFAGIKNSIKSITNNVKSKLDSMRSQPASTTAADTSIGSTPRSNYVDDYGTSTSGYTSRSYSTNGLDTGNRKL